MTLGEDAKSFNGAANKRPLRIGVLCNGSELARWQASCLAKVEEQGFARVVLFVCNSQTPGERPSLLRRLRAKFASGLLLWRIYERLVVDRKSKASEPISIPASFQDVPRIAVEPIPIGKFRQAFDARSLQMVREHELDVLLRFGFGILNGEILDAARFGIWSFHHGDPEHFRGAPPGFWEIHNGDPVTGVVLQRLTETLDGGVVLHAGWFKTHAASYTKSLDRILMGAAHFVARALTELLQDPDEFMSRMPLQKSGPIYRYPRTRSMLRFFRKSAAAKIRNQYLAFFRHQQWSIGVLNQAPEAIFAGLSGERRQVEGVNWLPERPGAFLADPFPVQVSGKDMIIAEEFDWQTGLGRISTVPFSGTGADRPVAAIQSPLHLSYPYTFDYGPDTFCVPECAASDGVLLYRLVRSEGCWTMHKKIIDGFPAVDPTIFVHEGRWWLFCTNAETGPNEFLYAWFADELTGQWQPHAQNPLKVDVRSARPAGPPFMCEGRLIRPAQDCSEVYGGAVTFNEILKLSPGEFYEERAGQLLPDCKRYPAGLHTISGFANHTIIDGARRTFVGSEFSRAVRRTFGRSRS